VRDLTLDFEPANKWGAGEFPLTHGVRAAESRNALGRRFSATNSR
jgi:hypothetical protein